MWTCLTSIGCGVFFAAHSLMKPLTSSRFSQDWKRWLNHAEERICYFPQTSTQPSGMPTSSSSLWVSSLCPVNIPHAEQLHLTLSTCHDFTSPAGQHPDQDLRDGEGSRGWPEVHRGVCPADRRGVRWLQNRHREEHGASAGRWEHQTDIRRQHQTQPQPAGLFSHMFTTLCYLLFLVSESRKLLLGSVQPRIPRGGNSGAGSEGAGPRPDWWGWDRRRSKGNQSAVCCLWTLGSQSTNHHHQHMVVWTLQTGEE